MAQGDTNATVDAVWRIESPRLIAALTRMTGDLGFAEDLAQDSLVAALEQWPQDGVPSSPGAWLTAVAKRRAIDIFRRNETLARKHQELAQELQLGEAQLGEQPQAQAEDELGDDLLGLIVLTCNPALVPEARVALTLRAVGGLTTKEIARAYLVQESTVAQRITRAKKTLAEQQVPFEVPSGSQLHERLPAVLEVIYLIFNEGYMASSGERLLRSELCLDAMRLGRVVESLAQRESEAHALVALMELQASRLPTRVDALGNPILLLEQNRTKWDRLLIRRGLEALARAEQCAQVPGSYLLQASIAACHARATEPEDTDWARIAALYELIGMLSPSPVAELNRAVAVGMAEGPGAGLAGVRQGQRAQGRERLRGHRGRGCGDRHRRCAAQAGHEPR